MDRLIQVFCRTIQSTDITKHRSGMIGILYVICLLALFSCASTPSATNGDLGVINLSGDYPTRRVDLKEIADVEYVALETTDSSLLTSMCADFSISEKYIITSDMYTGDIFFFTRSGEFIRKINMSGNGPGEYINLQQLAVDLETEECFVYDLHRKKVFIYSFEGEYKRSIPWMIANLYPWYNYNEDYLIGYHNSFSHKLLRCSDTHPFYVMSKKDGKLIPLNLKVPDGISSTLTIIKEKLNNGDIYVSQPSLPIHPLLMNGDEALIAEFSLDTLYSFKEERLTPIAVKIPSARSTTPPTIIVPELYTDSFLLFRVVSMYYDKSNHYKSYEDSDILIWNRKMNQVEKWEIYNSDMDATMSRYPVTIREAFSDKNMGLLFYTAETLITLNNEGKLKGKLKDVASKLQDEEDNKILLIAKYKQ